MAKAIGVSNNIEGNIGDCKVNQESYNVDFWTKEVVATNSCTGEIISQEQMFDHGFLWFSIPLLFALAVIIMALKSY